MARGRLRHGACRAPPSRPLERVMHRHSRLLCAARLDGVWAVRARQGARAGGPGPGRPAGLRPRSGTRRARRRRTRAPVARSRWWAGARCRRVHELAGGAHCRARGRVMQCRQHRGRQRGRAHARWRPARRRGGRCGQGAGGRGSARRRRGGRPGCGRARGADVGRHGAAAAQRAAQQLCGRDCALVRAAPAKSALVRHTRPDSACKSASETCAMPARV